MGGLNFELIHILPLDYIFSLLFYFFNLRQNLTHMLRQASNL